VIFVKICGITNLEDALLAIQAGAQALGFVFAPSQRRVTGEVAEQIIRQLPPSVEPVGVFVNETPAKILNIVAQTNISMIQLHGNENHSVCEYLSQFKKVIKAVKVKSAGELRNHLEFPVWKILLDTYLPGIAGGSGQRFDWQILNHLDLSNIIVAGGINPENVRELLQKYTPFGIDVSSGVETFPGKKDAGKLSRLFQQILLNHPRY